MSYSSTAHHAYRGYIYSLRGVLHLSSISENNIHLTRQPIIKMLRSAVRNPCSVLVNDYLYIWCDDDGWIGPARMAKVNLHDIEVSHNRSTKSSSINRVRGLKGTDNQTQSIHGDLDTVKPQT